MARTTPTAAPPAYVGTLIAPGVPDADGDILDANTTLVVACGATPTTVTIATTGTWEGFAIADVVTTVAANTTRAFRIGAAALFAQASDAAVGPGKVLVDYSSVATVTRWVLG